MGVAVWDEKEQRGFAPEKARSPAVCCALCRCLCLAARGSVLRNLDDEEPVIASSFDDQKYLDGFVAFAAF